MDRTGVDRKFYFGVFFVAYAAWLMIYSSVGHVASQLPTLDLTTPLDEAIPVMPGFVWIYDFCFLIPVFVIAFLPDGHVINRLIISIFVASITASVVYLLIPVANPLPELGNSISERWLTFHYQNDHPPGANKMPSLHVANAFMLWLAVREGWTAPAGSSRTAVWAARLGDLVMFGLAVTISASTVLIKQHLVIDVVTGIPWAFGSWWLAGRIYRAWSVDGLGPEDTVRSVLRRIFRRRSVSL